MVSNVKVKSVQQLRVEETQKLLDRDRKFNQAKLKHKDQLAMEVAMNTTMEIEKNVKRSVLERTQAVVDDPAFHKLIENLVDEKAKERLD